MKEIKQVDDHTLGMYLDGILDAAGCKAVIEALDRDPELRERYYQLRRTKDLMKLGFGNAMPPSSARSRGTTVRWQNAPRLAAAVAFAALTFGAGSLTQHYLATRDAETGNQALNPYAGIHETRRVILHISESDPDRFRRALDYTEEFLQAHESSGGRIEVVANAGGIDLLRPDTSPLAGKVVAMMRTHDNVHFIACANAIRALREQGIEPDFFENVYTKEPAMDFIINRVRSGWDYIKVESII